MVQYCAGVFSYSTGGALVATYLGNSEVTKEEEAAASIAILHCNTQLSSRATQTTMTRAVPLPHTPRSSSPTWLSAAFSPQLSLIIIPVVSFPLARVGPGNKAGTYAAASHQNRRRRWPGVCINFALVFEAKQDYKPRLAPAKVGGSCESRLESWELEVGGLANQNATSADHCSASKTNQQTASQQARRRRLRRTSFLTSCGTVVMG